MSGKSGVFITLYDAGGFCTNVLTAVSFFPVSDAEASEKKPKKKETKKNPKKLCFLRISLVESTFLLIQSSDFTSSCTWLQTRKETPPPLKKKPDAGY